MTRSTLLPELPLRQVKWEDLEETHGKGGERHLPHEMNVPGSQSVSDMYGLVLSSPRSPARASIRSKYLLVLVDLPTWRRSWVWSANSARIEPILRS